MVGFRFSLNLKKRQQQKPGIKLLGFFYAQNFACETKDIQKWTQK